MPQLHLVSDVRQYVTGSAVKCVTVTNLVRSDVDIFSKQIKNIKLYTFVIVLLEFHVIHGCNFVSLI